MVFLLCGLQFFSGTFESVTFAAGFEDMTTVRQTVQDGTGQASTAEHFDPLVEWQVGRDDDTGSFIGR